MKRMLVAVAICVVTLGLAAGDAEAKRLGGGRSTGMQRDTVTQRQATPPQNAAPVAPSPAPVPTPASPAPKRSWMGPLAGLAAGLGIGALLSHFGMGEGVANFLMIALLVIAAIVVIKLVFARRSSPGARPEPLQYAGIGAGGMAEPPASDSSRQGFPVTPPQPAMSALPASNIPAGFDVEGFLRIAKLNFIRLQAANDAGNLEDIREFVTPEMFAEIKLQLDERGKAPQQTDVVTLNAELLEVVSENTRHIASVRFSGMIREEIGAAAAPFDEVWNLSKPLEGAHGWVIAGIQQMA